MAPFDVGDAAYGLLTAPGNTMRRIGIALAFLMIGALTAAGTVRAQSLRIFRWQKEPYCNVISSTVVQTGGLFQAVGLFMWTITFGISTLSGSWGSWLLIHHDQFGDCVDRWLSKVPTDNWRDVEASGPQTALLDVLIPWRDIVG